MACCPLMEGGLQRRCFNQRKDEFLIDTSNRALDWQIQKGCTEWGAKRFELYGLGRITANALHGKTHSVRLREIKRTNVRGDEYIQSVNVDWKESDGHRQSKSFSIKKHGGLKEAYHFAGIEAAHRKAELTGGVLNLPDFTYDLSVIS
ncbi:hypothetical protein [Photobacterium leiognathi]|uniref:hypothetical protein n=1 Tax=Photobacterium leiognathi TaxID=553611 RepID=UPI00298207FD|nr:hypothetical protein [Photobacterium leiognathi]